MNTSALDENVSTLITRGVSDGLMSITVSLLDVAVLSSNAQGWTLVRVVLGSTGMGSEQVPSCTGRAEGRT